MTKSRDYVFTTNNYTQDHIDALAAIDCQYVCYGKEVAPSTGTPHLQGYIRFKSQKTISAAQKLMIGSWLEPKLGTCAQAIHYCKILNKEQKGQPDAQLKPACDIYERGEPPKDPRDQGRVEINRWKRINEKAFEGDEEWLMENEPSVYFRSLATFRSHKKPKTNVLSHSDEDTPNLWLYGPTRTGKSRYAREVAPVFYYKEQNKWWCGYTGQDVVLIEEASPKTMEHLASRLKVWSDRYPFPGEIKGGRIEGIRPDKIIVTSNYTIQECFPSPEDHLPMMERFKVVKFGEPQAPPPWHHSYNKPSA